MLSFPHIPMADQMTCSHDNMIKCPDCGKPMCADCKAACDCNHEEE